MNWIIFILSVAIILILIAILLQRPKGPEEVMAVPTEVERAPLFPVGTLLVQPSTHREFLTQTPSSSWIDLPDRFDARERWPGLITDPYHQGECGSCWAFASTMAISDRWRINHQGEEELRKKFIYRPFVIGKKLEYPVLNNLSPYHLINCDTCEGTVESDIECNNGCKGGYIQLVYDYIMESGIPTLLSNPTDCDPHKKFCPCRPIPNAKIYKPKRVYSVVGPNDSKETRRRKIMEELFQRGPITTAYMVYRSFYDHHLKTPNRVYTDSGRPRNDPEIGGHAVVLMGWGTEDGVFYWLMRNSWGIDWGNSGYFKIQYDFEGLLDNMMAAEI